MKREEYITRVNDEISAIYFAISIFFANVLY